jgi:hypothetical protein
MSWTEHDSERLFSILEGIRQILAVTGEAIERACERLAPPSKPPSSKRGAPR